LRVSNWRDYFFKGNKDANFKINVASPGERAKNSTFAELENELRVVGKVQGLARLDRDKQHSVLSELLLYQHVFEELVLLDSQGQEQTRVSRSSLTPS
jgi:hypothetical protein